MDDMESEIKGQVRPFCISIDYDDTFSSCRETWTSVINVLRGAGAKVVCITSRKRELHPINDFPGEVFYCEGRPKAEVAFENDLDVRVWIDDQPEYIGSDPQRRNLKTAMGIR
jgi:hypothetical protein